MGDVWEATNVVTGRAVAIKRLRLAPGATVGEVGRARFVLEAQTACAVEHPNVVEILDFVETEEEPPIIVMELLRGETLADRIERDQALGTEATATLLFPVVSAVGTAHARGIVHRDLKPANIFLQASDDRTIVKVLDFGIAKWVGARPNDVPLRTETGSTLGTPCYMAPEQAMGEKVIDQRADVWALGVILYECLSGMRPVEGENAAKIMVRLLSTGIMPLDKLVPGLPAELSALVMRMLSREPAQRPSSLAEVRRVLATLTTAQAPDFGEPQIELATPSETLSLPPGDTRAPLTRSVKTTPAGRSRVAPVAAAVTVAGIVALAFGLTRNPPNDAEHSAVGAQQPPAPQLANSSSAPTALAATAPAVAAPAAAVAPVPAPSARSVDEAAAPEGATPTRAVPARAKRAQRSSKAPDADAPNAVEADAPAGLAAGASCERSRDCASRLCLAFVCK